MKRDISQTKENTRVQSLDYTNQVRGGLMCCVGFSMFGSNIHRHAHQINVVSLCSWQHCKQNWSVRKQTQFFGKSSLGLCRDRRPNVLFCLGALKCTHSHPLTHTPTHTPTHAHTHAHTPANSFPRTRATANLYMLVQKRLHINGEGSNDTIQQLDKVRRPPTHPPTHSRAPAPTTFSFAHTWDFTFTDHGVHPRLARYDVRI